MKYNIRKNWIETIDLMVRKPVVLMPFVFIAFLEILMLELFYFSPREPLSFIAAPIIRKFFGESGLHYPGSLLILSKLFYYAQAAIYISIGVVLSAAAVNIFNSLKKDIPVRLSTALKNAAKRYFEYFLDGCLIMAGLFLLNELGAALMPKAAKLINRFLPQFSSSAFLYLVLMFFQFFVSILFYTFVLSIVPLMVIEKKSFLKSFGVSIFMGARNFFKLSLLIAVPFMIYLPLLIVKGFPGQLADKSFPEANVLLLVVGSIVTIFVDCFILLCVSQLVLDTRRVPQAKN